MLLKTLALIAGIGSVWASSSGKFFRRDYIYNEKYNAFYKLHWGDRSSDWEDAFVTCDDEGAKLFYPGSLDEWTIAANLTQILSLTDVEGIFVGVRDEFGLGDYVSIEGRLVPEFSRYATNREEGESKCVVMSVRTGSYSIGSCKHRRPFICKKVNKEFCPTIDSAYMYSAAAKKCYKVNRRPKIWSDALHTCFMEGGILATPTGNIESTLLFNFIDNQQFYFIGVRRILSDDSFFDLQGSIFELSTARNNRGNNCKVLSLNGQSNDYNRHQKFQINSYDCNTTLPFICEMQAEV